MCVSQVVVIVDGGILSAILQMLTRYSANDPQFPVNDWSLFTGKSHATSGASRPNGPADVERRREARLGACAPHGRVSSNSNLLSRTPTLHGGISAVGFKDNK
jgi:hypothetical protein